MASTGAVKALGICGSLRKGSYNRAALRAAAELLPDGMTLDVADISQLPLYNEDVRQAGFPPPAQLLRDRILAADAPAEPALRGQAGGHHGRDGEPVGHDARAVRSAQDVRLSEHVSAEQARGPDRAGAEQVRRRAQAHRQDHARHDRAIARRAARLDAPAAPGLSVSR